MADYKCDKCPYKEECHENDYVDLNCNDVIALMIAKGIKKKADMLDVDRHEQN